MLSKIAPECFLESNVCLDSSFFESPREIGSADCFCHFSQNPFRDRLRKHRTIASVGSMNAGHGCSNSIPRNLMNLTTPRVLNGYISSEFRSGDFSALRYRSGNV